MSRRKREVRALKKRREKEKANKKQHNLAKGGSVSRIDWLQYR